MEKEKAGFITKRAILAMDELVRRGKAGDSSEKVSYAMIARKFNTIPQSLSKIKAGIRDVQEDELMILINEFKVSPDFLFGLSEIVFKDSHENKICEDICGIIGNLKDKLPINFKIKSSFDLDDNNEKISQVILRFGK